MIMGNVVSSWQQNVVLDTQTQVEAVVDGLVHVSRSRGGWLILQLNWRLLPGLFFCLVTQVRLFRGHRRGFGLLKHPSVLVTCAWQLPLFITPCLDCLYICPLKKRIFISPGFVWCAGLANNISWRKYCTGPWQCNLKSWSLAVCGPVLSHTRDLDFCLVAEETWWIWSNCLDEDEVQLGNRTLFTRKDWHGN